jgi:hypothetical protein
VHAASSVLLAGDGSGWLRTPPSWASGGLAGEIVPWPHANGQAPAGH